MLIFYLSDALFYHVSELRVLHGCCHSLLVVDLLVDIFLNGVCTLSHKNIQLTPLS